jgi:hypothetical protein
MALESNCEKCGRKLRGGRFCTACRTTENRENRASRAYDYTCRQTPEFKAKERERYVTMSTASREVIAAAKARPCADCGNSFPAWIMDFDHIAERGPKLFKLSSYASRKPETVAAEIAKCDVICSNCHRIRSKARKEGVWAVRE